MPDGAGPAPAAVPVRWVPRDLPLPPEAAWFPDARRHAARWARDPRRAAWRGLALDDALLLRGPDLPWTPDAVWLGVDPLAPSLLVPTRLRADPSLDLVAAALDRLHPELERPLVLLPHLGRLVAGGDAARLDPARLADWARR